MVLLSDSNLSVRPGLAPQPVPAYRQAGNINELGHNKKDVISKNAT